MITTPRTRILLPATCAVLLLAACGDADTETTGTPSSEARDTSRPHADGSTDANPGTSAGPPAASSTPQDSTTPSPNPTEIFLDIDVGHACGHYSETPRPLAAADDEFGALPVIDNTHVLYLVDLPDPVDGLRTGWLDLQVRRAGRYALFSDVPPDRLTLYALDGTEIAPLRERREVRSCDAIGWYMAFSLVEGTFPVEVVVDEGQDALRLLLEDI